MARQEQSAGTVLDGILPEQGAQTCATAPPVGRRGFPASNHDFTGQIQIELAFEAGLKF